MICLWFMAGSVGQLLKGMTAMEIEIEWQILAESVSSRPMP